MLAASFPAFIAPRFQVNDVLKTGVASVLGGRGSRTRSALVLLQVALALVLLIGSGLLQRVLAVHWGFNPERLLTLEMRLSESKYGTPSKHMQRPGGPILVISPSYFQTMGTAILAGRPFAPSDHAQAERVAIVNAAFARQFYPGGDALGKRIQWGANEEYTTIVGISADMRQRGRESKVDTELFLPAAQNPVRPVNLMIRTKTEPTAFAPAARMAVWATDKDQPIYSVASMNDLIRQSGANRRIETLLVSFLGMLATILAAIGIYGVVAETISQRTGEIGLRMALGARTGDILRMVLLRSLLLTLGGIAVGTGAGLYVVRYLQSLIFGVDLRDAVTFASAGGFLLFVALVAAYLPARRSASIDPAATLRSQ